MNQRGTFAISQYFILVKPYYVILLFFLLALDFFTLVHTVHSYINTEMTQTALDPSKGQMIQSRDFTVLSRITLTIRDSGTEAKGF